jgi:hypothetical protein
METDMKTIISAVAASFLLAGIAAPASAESRVEKLLKDFVKTDGGKGSKSTKLPKDLEKFASGLKLDGKGGGDLMKMFTDGIRGLR